MCYRYCLYSILNYDLHLLYTIFDNVATVIDLSSKANDDNDSNTLNLIWDATTQSTLWSFVGSGGVQSVVLAPKIIQSLNNQTDTLTFTAKDAENRSEEHTSEL